jgi:hypothetical protein
MATAVKLNGKRLLPSNGAVLRIMLPLLAWAAAVVVVFGVTVVQLKGLKAPLSSLNGGASGVGGRLHGVAGEPPHPAQAGGPHCTPPTSAIDASTPIIQPHPASSPLSPLPARAAAGHVTYRVSRARLFGNRLAFELREDLRAPLLQELATLRHEYEVQGGDGGGVARLGPGLGAGLGPRG